ncbi:MAG: hypothetical protein KC414_11165, partial [Romboutsia sp.]|nr:hypothetical protein [Romboutsia sp.]
MSEAEKLSATSKNDSNYNKNLNASISIYNRICLNTDVNNEIRLKALISYIKHIPIEGLDMLTRWRDMTRYLQGNAKDKHYELLKMIIKSHEISSHERITTAVMLYNVGRIDICFDLFEYLSTDFTVLVNHRVDACRFLFATETENYMAIAQEALLEIIDTSQYPVEYRYKIIASFIFGKKGISTLMNFEKIQVPYNEEFVCGLQTVFFYNEENNVRYRILSGQHLLQMDCVEEDDKESIANILLDIANNETFEENIRADAADTVMRICSGKLRKRARTIIQHLGNSGFVTRGVNVYNDSQNVHNAGISESTTEYLINFIEEFVNKYEDEIPTFDIIHSQVVNLIKSQDTTPEQKHKCYKSLN